jgi:hypothetical protein
MFNITEIMIDAFVQHLQRAYHRTYGGYQSDYADIIGWAGNMALENIANTDALYHNVDHTILVTLVGQEILRGKHIREGGVRPEDWLHFAISLLCHDIGYVKGVCRADKGPCYATGIETLPVELPPGATDAALTPYHVDRGKLFVEERFGGHKLIDVERIKEAIEPTRFPVPLAGDTTDTTGLPGLVRAADLIGQLSDPRYLNKIPALFHEFLETGVAPKLGFRDPGDLRRSYPKFYWSRVYPYIRDALEYLALTQEGKQIRANLYANVFMIEHEAAPMGYEPHSPAGAEP